MRIGFIIVITIIITLAAIITAEIWAKRSTQYANRAARSLRPADTGTAREPLSYVANHFILHSG